MNSDVHHLVTVNDGKSDTAEIIKVFSEIAAGRLKSDLKLLNYVDEVPVSYGSVINSVSNDSVELAVHEHQAVIMKHHKSTLVKSRHFNNELGVHCYATYVNIPKKTVILNNFAYAQIRAERREAVRVKIRRELPVRFTCENVNIEGNMIDISGSGISILSSLMPRIDTNQNGYLHFKLSDSPKLSAISNVNVHAAPTQLYKLCQNIFRPHPGFKHLCDNSGTYLVTYHHPHQLNPQIP